MKNRSLDDVFGYEEEKRALREVLDMSRNPDKYAALGVEPPKGYLLYGVPGVGKTLMMEALIAEMGRPCFTLRKTKSCRDFMPVIEETFEKAKEAAPSVVFLDDLDKFSADDDSDDPEELVAVQAGIDSVADCDVFVLATANDLGRIPHSVMRPGRLGRIMEINPPVHNDAIKIVGHYLEGKKIAPDITAESVARMMSGESCAALQSVLENAGTEAAFAGKNVIEKDDIVKAALRVVYESDDDGTLRMSPEERREISVHEAGHAVARLVHDPDGVSLVSVYKRKWQEGGITVFFRRDGAYESAEEMRRELVCDMAGSAAVRKEFAHTDVGASSDYTHAMRTAERLVKNLGADGFEYLAGVLGTTESGAQNDAIVRVRNAEISRAFDEATRLLTENWDLVEAIAGALAERQILDYEDIKAIYASLRPAA